MSGRCCARHHVACPQCVGTPLRPRLRPQAGRVRILKLQRAGAGSGRPSMPPDVAGKRGGNPPGRLSFNLKFPIRRHRDSELEPGKPPVSRVRGSRLGLGVAAAVKLGSRGEGGGPSISGPASHAQRPSYYPHSCSKPLKGTWCDSGSDPERTDEPAARGKALAVVSASLTTVPVAGSARRPA